jgi:protein involved in polysaccharide export with SLBB domain
MMMKNLAALLLVSVLVVPVLAQMPSQGDNLSASPSQGAVDCSDPLLGGTAQCSGQNQSGFTSLGASGSRGATAAGYGARPFGASGGYSDVESYARQRVGANQIFQAPLRPEPLSEFQKFVASTTGQILPIYGANLFRQVPTTFAPLDMTPVPPDYVIGPGDELRIRIWGQVNFQANVRVDRSGEIYLPQVGPVHVAGMPFSALDEHLRSAVGRVYRNFDLTVDVGQIRSIQVYVAGEARRPGVYTLSSLSTLIDALFATGGPSIQGSLRHIELRRGSTVVTNFDLYDLLLHGDKSKDAKLLPGDVIFIPPVGPEAAVTGSVRNPAIYELHAGDSLNDLLVDAGGVSAVAAEARVSIERIDNHRNRQAMEVAYDAHGLGTPLADGDMVRVYSIIPQYQKTVILRGNIANPGRFAWHPGMRISELIPDKDSLITRNYWWRRAQLGLPAPDFEPIPGFSNLRQPANNQPISLRSLSQQRTAFLGPFGAGYQSQYGTGDESQSGPGYGNEPGSAQGPVDYYLQAQQGQQGEQGAMQGETAPQEEQNPSAQRRFGSSSLAAAESNLPGQAIYPQQRTVVNQLAPEIDWDYAVIERLDPKTLKTVLVPFDLGKLVLQHDPSQDLELQPGDVVTIFSGADIRIPIAHQVKIVRLDGEIVHAGAYTVQPGETLRDLVERAGGLTPNAYLYGSEFTRESTRALQQARMNEYTRTLAMRMQRGTMALAASSPNSALDPTASAAAQTGEQALLADIRQLRATGRIVLEIKPADKSVDSLPKITLENGDHFDVPSVPASVNVVGAVYDQNSFLYARSRRVNAYLKLAGGPTRDADRHHAFIIRADGEVVSRDSGTGLWTNNFDNLRLYPGDTIVVPEKAFKPSALRGVIDWSQMVSQFALGAAALSVIH